MIYSPSVSDGYGSDVFPVIADAIFDYEKSRSKESIAKISKSLSITVYTIQSAITILKDPIDFSRDHKKKEFIL